MQCYSMSCPMQVATAEDLVAHVEGGYIKAAHYIGVSVDRAPDLATAARREQERKVLDSWLALCFLPETTAATKLISKAQARGLGVKTSRLGSVVLDAGRMELLRDMAIETGAEYPDGWTTNPPTAAQVVCVQTRPHTIDRLIIYKNNGHTDEVVWNRFSAGVTGLMGILPKRRKFLAADATAAMRLQYEMLRQGHHEEVAFIHQDLFRGDRCPRWGLDYHMLTAVVRHGRPQPNPHHSSPADLVKFQQVFDRYPGLEGSTRALPIDMAAKLGPNHRAKSWAGIRCSMINIMIPPGSLQVPADAASLIEQTGTRDEDIVRLSEVFSKRGDDRLVEDIELLALTRVISHDKKGLVKETANDYRLTKDAETITLANFSVRISSVVAFPHHNADRFCQATLRCGKAVTNVIFPQNLLHDKVHSLESEMQRQLQMDGKISEAGKMPTVIAVGKFRNHIIPYLRSQAADAKPIAGVDQLGWSDNRRSFTFPGFITYKDKTEPTSNILCPSVSVLKRFKAQPMEAWAESCPTKLDRSCADMAAMVVASTTRYFRRCNTGPIYIAQSSDATTILDKIALALGQQEIHPINPNDRAGNRIAGVYGYPLLAGGLRHATAGADIPYFHLTDKGYSFPTRPTTEQAEHAGRAVQFCLRKVVEWCLTTGGDEFCERPSLVHYKSLLREGRWLIENVCGYKDLEVSHDEQTALEKLLVQIPHEDTGRRITLIDGTDLVIDLTDLEHDHNGIIRETRDMGAVSAIEDGKILASAIKLLPAISTYYGQEPDVTLITK